MASKGAGSVAILENKIHSLRVKFIYLLYRLLGLAAFPLFLLYAAKRVAADARYRKGLGERFGFLSPALFGTKPSGIWLHAVSVGEVLSAISLLKELRRRLPETGIWVSVATLAGRELAEQRLQGLADGVFFAPVDSVWIVRRVLRTLQPCLHINLETEIWPNRLRELKRAGAMVAQVNARISDKAWPSYERFGWFWPAVLLHIDWMGSQSAKDGERFRALGYAGPLEDLGNLKYDFDPAARPVADDLRALLESWRDRPLWIAASTVGATGPGDLDEEDAVLDAFQEMGNHARLVLAPRKPERFSEVAEKLRGRGLAFRQRTRLSEGGSGSILLLDSLGELSGLFPYAQAVFVGGSLCRWGGHNILEPAYFGKAILTGPFMQNFAAIQEMFLAAEAVQVVPTAGELAARVQSLLESDGGQGERARVLAESLRGVSRRLADRLLPLLEQGIPRNELPGAAWTRPLSLLWKLGAKWPRTPRRLQAAVISVGNLSMGGTGKTPVTLALAEELERRGYRVGILTRGYGRREGRPVILLPGEQAPVEATGDEAQLYCKSGRFALGIGADRYECGRRLLDRFEADFLLLDDGFQHKALHRDFDLVLIDASLPFPGFAVPPVGLLREELSALERADAFLLSRTEAGRRYERLRAQLPAGKAVHVCEEILKLSRPVEESEALAFCGLGNPAGFRQSLQRVGLGKIPLRCFPDHHRYSAAEEQELRLSASTLVTSSKDAVKWRKSDDLVILEQKLLLPSELVERILEKSFLAAQGAERA